MENIVIKLYSKGPHISQILTGFCMVERNSKTNKCRVKLESSDGNIQGEFVEVLYKGKRIIYDVLDGYQDKAAISALLKQCDFYFKRSYSPEKNRTLDIRDVEKMYPLGMNYHVSCPFHPLDKPYWKERIKQLLHIERNMYSNTYFSSRRFEEKPRYKDRGIVVLFATRLWSPEQSLSKSINDERKYINTMRLNIIRELKAMPDIEFIGGISDSSFSRSMAPELIIPEEMTNRKSYIKLMHKADICIGTMGLHESIGWKTGEYVASSKAIVSETLHYQVPGDFAEGKNYLAFTDAQECLAEVRWLISNPDQLYEMKLANQNYYRHYLKPDSMIRNTLKIVDLSIQESN